MAAEITIDSWYGGMANDQYVTSQPGSFFYSENIDVRENSKSFRLATGHVAYSKQLPGSANEFRGYYGAADTGYGYSENGIVVDLTTMLSVGTVTGDNIANTIVFKDQTGADGSFIAGFARIHKHIAGGAVTSNIGVYSPGSFALKPTTRRPLLKSKLWIYIGDIDGVARYAIDTQVIDRPLVLEKSDVVQSIIEMGDQIIIFTTNGSNGRQYFWDGVSRVPNRMIEWFANPCYYAAIFKNQIYVLTQNGFYVSDGYNSQLLLRTDSTRFDFTYAGNQSYLVYDTTLDIFYFSFVGPRNSLYSYGERLPGFGKSFINSFCRFPLNGSDRDPNLPLGYFSNFQVNGSDIYYCTSGALQSYFVKLSGYSAKGYLETMPFIGAGFGAKKQSDKVSLTYFLPDVTKTGVKLYASYDGGAYALIFESNTSNSVVGYNRRYVTETKSWYKRQLKIELTTTDPTMTPEFYEVTLLFSPSIEDGLRANQTI